MVKAGLLLLALQLACVTTRLGGIAPRVGVDTGTFSIGTTRHHVDMCRSGDLEYFLGVDLEDRAAGAVVRLFIDPMDGPRLRVIQGTGESREVAILARSQCRQLEVDLRPTGWRVNTVRDFSGSLDAECASDLGHEVSVHVRFEHCH